jgi:hypothetical protein
MNSIASNEGVCVTVTSGNPDEKVSLSRSNSEETVSNLNLHANKKKSPQIDLPSKLSMHQHGMKVTAFNTPYDSVKENGNIAYRQDEINQSTKDKQPENPEAIMISGNETSIDMTLNEPQNISLKHQSHHAHSNEVAYPPTIVERDRYLKLTGSEINVQDDNTSSSSKEGVSMQLSSSSFQQWLVQKKMIWNFEHRIKKSFATSIDFDTSGRKFKYGCAKPFGLPEGWTVRIQPRSRYTFRAPNGKLFYSKKSVFEYFTSCGKGSYDLTQFSGQTVLQCTSTQVVLKPVDGSSSTSIEQESMETNISQRPTIGIGNTKEAKDADESQSSEPSIPSKEEALSDIINRLNRARAIVTEFGPIPWKRCKIINVPPAPSILGMHLQVFPSRFGAGIVFVNPTSPLQGQVSCGDIITHFMGIPLYGLEANDIVRLIQSEDVQDRVFQVAPSDFEFNLDELSSHDEIEISESNISVAGENDSKGNGIELDDTTKESDEKVNDTSSRTKLVIDLTNVLKTQISNANEKLPILVQKSHIEKTYPTKTSLLLTTQTAQNDEKKTNVCKPRCELALFYFDHFVTNQSSSLFS